ncbi:MAG: hypothetical protein ACWA5A_02475 [Marinibacterium sp.]
MLKRTSTRPAPPTIVSFDGSNGRNQSRTDRLPDADNLSDGPRLQGDVVAIPAATMAMAAEALNPEAREFSQDPEAMAAAIAGLDPDNPDNAGALGQIADGIASALTEAEDGAQVQTKAAKDDAASADLVDPVAASTDLGTEGLAELSALLGLRADIIPRVPEDDDAADPTQG